MCTFLVQPCYYMHKQLFIISLFNKPKGHFSGKFWSLEMSICQMVQWHPESHADCPGWVTFTKALFLGCSCGMQATLTCTGTCCKAHPLPSSVKDHVESLHHGGTNYQSICGRGDTKAIAFIIETSSHHGLNVELVVEEPRERHRTKHGLDKGLKREVTLCSESPPRTNGQGR